MTVFDELFRLLIKSQNTIVIKIDRIKLKWIKN